MWTRDTLEFLLDLTSRFTVRCVDEDAENKVRVVLKAHSQIKEELCALELKLKEPVSTFHLQLAKEALARGEGTCNLKFNQKE
jgi:hypothetical protein